MSVREGPPQPVPPPENSMPPMRDEPLEPPPYPAEKARGASLDLQEPWQKIVFFGGLAGAVLLILVLGFLAAA